MKLFPEDPIHDLFGIEDIMKPNEQPTPAAVRTAPTTPASTPTAQRPADVPKALAALQQEVANCAKCHLSLTRTNTVFGEGSPSARLMFVGEGPGADEDASGRPFIGKAGQLLTKMIIAMGLTREEVYIANIVKCRPPENRNPMPAEAAACIGYLKTQIAAIAPEIIVCLGSTAVNYLLQDPTPITRLRGNWRSFEGVRVMPTYHPSYLLRAPNKKGEAWIDLKLVMKELGIGGE